MRIALYNRWLLTQGGGERHSLALAAVLAERYQVTVVTHQPADLTEIGTFLGLDLRRLELATVPDSPTGRFVCALSAKYDLFLGASHTDVIAARARRNGLLVFFPAPLPADSPPPVQLGGWYPTETDKEGPFRWSEAGARLSFAPLGAPRVVELLLAGPRPGTRLWVACAGRRTAEVVGVVPRWLSVALPAGSTEIALGCDAPYTPPGDPRVLGVALYGVRTRAAGWRCQRGWTLPVDRLPVEPALTAAALESYQLVLANSHFTQHWIERRWGRSSEVLYPPIDVVSSTPAQKQHVILSVGRFFPGGHSKQHDVLIAAFKQLCAAGVVGWRLLLVGGLDTAAPTHQRHFEHLAAQIGDAPITLLPNMPPEELRRTYATASIYWHAGGYGVDLEQQPELAEHFGMSVAEALGAGTVPIVYGAGGPAEIVRPGVDGLHWQTVAELVDATRDLATNSEQRAVLARQGRQRAAAFGTDTFRRRVWELWPRLEPPQ